MDNANWSPMQLRHYHFLRVEVAARESLLDDLDNSQQAPNVDFEGIPLEPEVSLFSSEDDGEHGPYMLRLALKYDPPQGSTFPYRFDVALAGIIEVTAPDKLDDCKRLTVINGASMLYSAAREMLLTLTSRHLYGPMLLPTLNFQHLDL